MPAKRPVADSEGGKYLSITDAACAVWASTGSIHAAIQATRRGKYRTVEKLQWAYADEVPEVWPAAASQQKPQECPMRYCGFCPHRDQKED